MAHNSSVESVAENESISVKDKAVIVTGGTTGIGRATALLFASEGARVLVCGRHKKELDDALTDLKVQNPQSTGIVADIAQIDDVKRLFKEADETFGGVDVLINNAGIAAGSITEDDFSDWTNAISTNLLGHMACCREAWERMKSNHGGHIVNVGSLSAKVRDEGSDVYVATKSGMRGFSEALRKRVNRDGIKVTLIEPGNVGTDMSDEPPREQVKDIAEGKMLKAEDIAACIYYAVTQPARCDVVSIQIRPHLQKI